MVGNNFLKKKKVLKTQGSRNISLEVYVVQYMLYLETRDTYIYPKLKNKIPGRKKTLYNTMKYQKLPISYKSNLRSLIGLEITVSVSRPLIGQSSPPGGVHNGMQESSLHGALKTRRCSGLDSWIIRVLSFKNKEVLWIGLVDCPRVEL